MGDPRVSNCILTGLISKIIILTPCSSQMVTYEKLLTISVRSDITTFLNLTQL